MVGLAQDFYYAEIPKPEMEQFLTRARQGDFGSVFEATDDADHLWAFILNSHFDRTRASWMFTTKLSPERDGLRALDFGSGWGVNATALAPYFDEVVAVELSWHRLLNLALLARRWNLDNITAICGGDTPRLPFPDRWFDLVVLNGVIEWIPVGRSGNPRRNQIEFLKEIARVTKRDGELFLASENRYAYHYWAGRPDDHTNLRFGSLLPRLIAHFYSKLRRGQPYQNYTYSVSQYRRLARAAGFGYAEFHGLVPTHRLFHKIFPLSRGRVLDREETRGARVKDALLRTRQAARLVSAIGLRATFQKPEESYCQRLARYLNHAGVLPGPLEPEPYRVITTNFAAKMAFRGIDRRSGLLARIPLTPFKRDLLNNGLSEQRRWLTCGVIGPLVSPILRAEVFEGTRLFVETLSPALQRSGENSSKVFDRVEEVLVRFATSQETAPALDRWWAEISGLVAYLPSAHKPVLERLLEAAPNHLRTCYHHGDFHLGNLLVHRNRILERIVDWEWATPRGYPLADFLHFTVNYPGIRAINSYISVLRNVVVGKFPHPRLRRTAEHLLEVHGLVWSDLRFLAVVYIYHTLNKYWEASRSYGLEKRFLGAAEHLVAREALELANETA